MADSIAFPKHVLPPFTPRKVLILDEGREWFDGKYGVPFEGPTVDQEPAFWHALAEMNFLPEDVASCSIDPSAGVRPVIQRNLVWQSLPVVTRIGFDYRVEGQAVFKRGLAKRQSAQVIDSEGLQIWACFDEADQAKSLSPKAICAAKVVVLDLRNFTDREVRRHTCVFDDIPDEALPKFMTFSDGVFKELPARYIHHLRSKFEAEERFHATHCQNAAIFIGRALYHVLPRERSSAGMLAGAIATDRNQLSVFGDPMAVQILFEAARKGISDSADWVNPSSHEDKDYWKHWNEMRASLIHASGHVEGTSEKGNPRFVWRGNGKYPPLVIDDGFTLDKLSGLYYSLTSLKLISLKTDRSISITPLGLKLVSYFGKSGDDRDALLRWRTDDGTNGTQSDIPSMDRWLNRFLRETKRKVADLRPFSYTERGGEGGPPKEWHRYAFGGSIDFSPDNFADDERERLRKWLDETDVANENRPWWASNFGVIRNQYMEDGRNRVGIWFGHPIGVGAGWTDRAPAATPDMNLTAEAARQGLPDWLRDKFTHALDVIRVGATHERGFTLNETWDESEPEKRRKDMRESIAKQRAAGRIVMDTSSNPVIRGWRIPIDDLSKFEPDAVRLIGQMRSLWTAPRDSRYFTFTLGKSDDKLYAVVGYQQWAEGWARGGRSSSTQFFVRPLVQHIKEHYGSLIAHDLAEGLASWHVDENAGKISQIKFEDELVEDIDALFAEPQASGRSRPSF